MNSTATDEIDLQQLAIDVIKYFSRHYKFIFLSTVLGLLLGLTAYLNLPSVYESKMLISSDILTESYSEQLGENLRRLILEKNDSVIAAKINLTDEEAHAIKGIEIESAKKPNTEANAKDPTLFIITAEVKDKRILPKLQEGLINFLRNNEYVRTRVRLREETNRSMIAKLDKEISAVDSLKRRIFNGKPVTSHSSEVMLMDPAGIFEASIELNKQRLDYLAGLELSNSIQVVEGFGAFKKPANPKLSVALGLGLLFGFGAAVMLLSFRKLIRLARQKTQ